MLRNYGEKSASLEVCAPQCHYHRIQTNIHYKPDGISYIIIAHALNVGENAIAAFSFAGLTFPGGEMPARLICRPYFCRWKVTGLCLPVLKCH